METANVPCLICGEVGGGGVADGIVKVEVIDLEESSDQSLPSSRKWSENEKKIYQWFVTWFKLEPVLFKKASKGKRISNLGWEVDADDKINFPFCGGCSDKLRLLVELQKKLEELEGMIRNGVEELKIKANDCEDKFEEMGTYGKDLTGRYKRVRTVIVTDFKTRYAKKKEGDTQIIRKSARRSQHDLSSSDQLDNKLEELIPPKDTNQLEANPPGLDLIGGNLMEDMPISSSKRTRRGSKISDKLLEAMEEEPSFFDDNDSFDDDKVDDLDFDKDYNPEMPPPPPSGRQRTRNKRKIQVVVEEDDEDDSEQLEEEDEDKEWEGPDDQMELSSDEQSSEEDDSLLEPDFDTRKKPRCLVDPEKGTLTYRNLVFHLQDPPTSKIYKCSECSMTVKFGSTNNLRCHFVKYHSNCYMCKECDYRADSKCRLKQHIASIHEGIPSKKKFRKLKPCPICERPCTSTCMKRHLWSHKNLEERQQALQNGGEDIPQEQVRKHQCDLCGHKFRSNFALQRHKDSVHAQDDAQKKKELCSECGGTFVDLKLHQKYMHGGDELRKFRCLEEGCGKAFNTQTQLSRHKDAMHLKIRPWKCSRCPRTFTNEKKLKYHEDIHDGIRPFQCEHCPSSFGRKAHLQVHMKAYHSGGPQPKRKPFRRGTTMLPRDVKKQDLVNKGKYLPPSALATWAAGREPTSHFLIGGHVKASTSSNFDTNSSSSQDNYYYQK